MQNRSLTLLLIISLIGVGVFGLVESNKSQALKRENQDLRAELEKQKATADELKEKVSWTSKDREDLRHRMDELNGAFSNVRKSAATNEVLLAKALTNSTKKSGLGGFLAKMMENPDAKKMIGEQQKMAMKSIYGSLAKELGLNDADTEKLYGFLGDSQMKNLELGASLMEKIEQGGNKEELSKAFPDQKKITDEGLRAMLGDEKFAQYEDYSKTMGPRLAIDQLKAQLSGGEAPLQGEQSTALMQLIKEETMNVSEQSGLGPDGHFKDAQDFSNILSEDKLNKVFERQEAINQRVFERAKAILTPPQLDAYQKMVTNQMAMQKMGVKMAQQMMGGGGK